MSGLGSGESLSTSLSLSRILSFSGAHGRANFTHSISNCCTAGKRTRRGEGHAACRPYIFRRDATFSGSVSHAGPAARVAAITVANKGPTAV